MSAPGFRATAPSSAMAVISRRAVRVNRTAFVLKKCKSADFLCYSGDLQAEEAKKHNGGHQTWYDLPIKHDLKRYGFF